MSQAGSQVGLHTVLTALARADVDFVVCGGVACIAHGVARTTAEVACCVRLDDSNLRRLIGALAPLGFRLRAPEPIDALADADRRAAWIAEKGAMVATLVSERTPIQVDVFLRYPIGFDVLDRDATRVDVAGVPIRVSSKPHLIQAKRQVVPQRTVDRRDIEDLEEIIRRERRT